MALDSIFDSPGKGGAGFNPLNLLGDIFRASGGPVKKGQPYVVGEKRAELFVPDQNGSIVPRVPTNAPTMPSLASVSSGNQSGMSAFTYAPVIDARGASVDAVARLERVMAKDRAEFESRTVAAVRNAQKRRVL